MPVNENTRESRNNLGCNSMNTEKGSKKKKWKKGRSNMAWTDENKIKIRRKPLWETGICVVYNKKTGEGENFEKTKKLIEFVVVNPVLLMGGYRYLHVSDSCKNSLKLKIINWWPTCQPTTSKVHLPGGGRSFLDFLRLLPLFFSRFSKKT